MEILKQVLVHLIINILTLSSRCFTSPSHFLVSLLNDPYLPSGTSSILQLNPRILAIPSSRSKRYPSNLALPSKYSPSLASLPRKKYAKYPYHFLICVFPHVSTLSHRKTPGNRQQFAQNIKLTFSPPHHAGFYCTPPVNNEMVGHKNNGELLHYFAIIGNNKNRRRWRTTVFHSHTRGAKSEHKNNQQRGREVGSGKWVAGCWMAGSPHHQKWSPETCHHDESFVLKRLHNLRKHFAHRTCVIDAIRRIPSADLLEALL